MQFEEITDTIADLNPEDRVFRAVGHIVKIKTLHDDMNSRIGQEIYVLTGSICDELGKVKEDGRGGLHVHNLGHTCTIQAKNVIAEDGTTTLGPMDIIEHLRESTEIVIGETIQALMHFEARHGGKGVGSLSEFKARGQTKH